MLHMAGIQGITATIHGMSMHAYEFGHIKRAPGLLTLEKIVHSVVVAGFFYNISLS